MRDISEAETMAWSAQKAHKTLCGPRRKKPQKGLAGVRHGGGTKPVRDRGNRGGEKKIVGLKRGILDCQRYLSDEKKRFLWDKGVLLARSDPSSIGSTLRMGAWAGPELGDPTKGAGSY